MSIAALSQRAAELHRDGSNRAALDKYEEALALAPWNPRVLMGAFIAARALGGMRLAGPYIVRFAAIVAAEGRLLRAQILLFQHGLRGERVLADAHAALIAEGYRRGYDWEAAPAGRAEVPAPGARRHRPKPWQIPSRVEWYRWWKGVPISPAPRSANGPPPVEDPEVHVATRGAPLACWAPPHPRDTAAALVFLADAIELLKGWTGEWTEARIAVAGRFARAAHGILEGCPSSLARGKAVELIVRTPTGLDEAGVEDRMAQLSTAVAQLPMIGPHPDLDHDFLWLYGLHRLSWYRFQARCTEDAEAALQQLLAYLERTGQRGLHASIVRLRLAELALVDRGGRGFAHLFDRAVQPLRAAFVRTGSAASFLYASELALGLALGAWWALDNGDIAGARGALDEAERALALRPDLGQEDEHLARATCLEVQARLEQAEGDFLLARLHLAGALGLRERAGRRVLPRARTEQHLARLRAESVACERLLGLEPARYRPGPAVLTGRTARQGRS